MKVQDLINVAKSRCGFDDFGGDSFREGLGRLVNSINSQSSLTDLGKLMAPEMLIASLTNRLEVEHWSSSRDRGGENHRPAVWSRPAQNRQHRPQLHAGV